MTRLFDVSSYPIPFLLLALLSTSACGAAVLPYARIDRAIAVLEALKGARS